MRIKHTPNESYMVYSYLPCRGELCWYPYKHYRSKQSALNAIKRIKDDNKELSSVRELVWKIVWSPYPFASDEECVTIYTEEK